MMKSVKDGKLKAKNSAFNLKNQSIQYISKKVSIGQGMDVGTLEQKRTSKEKLHSSKAGLHKICGVSGTTSTM